MYVVWVPELGAHEQNVAKATSLVPDGRALHFWNPSESLGKEYERILSTTPEPAWDVYFVFGKSVRWADQPPQPDFWMQQLVAAEGKAPLLDGSVFAADVARRLTR